MEILEFFYLVVCYDADGREFLFGTNVFLKARDIVIEEASKRSFGDWMYGIYDTRVRKVVFFISCGTSYCPNSIKSK